MFQKLSKQMMQNNPLFKRAEEMVQGKSEQEQHNMYLEQSVEIMFMQTS